jgi:hypothetical protein
MASEAGDRQRTSVCNKGWHERTQRGFSHLSRSGLIGCGGPPHRPWPSLVKANIELPCSRLPEAWLKAIALGCRLQRHPWQTHRRSLIPSSFRAASRHRPRRCAVRELAPRVKREPLPSALATRLRQLDPKWCVILLNGLTVSSWRHRHAAPAAVDQARAKRPVASGSDRQIQSLER